MDVLFVTNTLHRGGAEAHLLLLGKGLRSRGVGCEVAFLRSAVEGGSVDMRDAFERAGIRSHYLACERFYDLRAGVRLNRLLKARKWDVLHSHLPRADVAAAMCRLSSRSVRWISTLHHPYDNAYAGAPFIPFLAPMWRRADGIIAVSEPVREWAIRRLGVAPERVRTIVHGIASEEPAVPTADVPTAGRRNRRIGSIGRYEERKNHETLIRAMVRVVDEFPDAELQIAGHDPWGYGEVLRRLIDELGLQQHVHLVGFMSNMKAFLADIDVFAFASRSEGFGIVLLEAMEAGKPSVVTDIAPLNGIITPGRSGVVAKPDDPDSFAEAIASLLRDPACVHVMGEEARRRVATEFSQTAMVEKTLEQYRAVIRA
jgi:glycosyltransferase involved in cell wall biosynthesis